MIQHSLACKSAIYSYHAFTCFNTVTYQNTFTGWIIQPYLLMITGAIDSDASWVELLIIV